VTGAAVTRSTGEGARRISSGHCPCTCGFLTSLVDITDRTRLESERARIARDHAALAIRLISIQDEERQRIAPNLHDDIGQQVTALASSDSIPAVNFGQLDWLSRVSFQLDIAPIVTSDDSGGTRELSLAVAIVVNPQLDKGKRIVNGAGTIDGFPDADRSVGGEKDSLATIVSGYGVSIVQVPGKPRRVSDVPHTRQIPERVEHGFLPARHRIEQPLSFGFVRPSLNHDFELSSDRRGTRPASAQCDSREDLLV
jgi:hypothetical protein